MNKIQALERLTTYKIQVLERSNETKPNIHTQAEEFRAESTTPFHGETERQRSKDIRKSNLISPVNMKKKKLPRARHPQHFVKVNLKPV